MAFSKAEKERQIREGLERQGLLNNVPVVPTFAVALDEIMARQDEAARSRRRKKGRAATILTGKEGAGLPSTAAAVLLGE